LIETVLASLHKEKVAVEVARAFHAAVQAREMATLLNLPQPEEVFIAALLGRIGHIAFWCFAGEVGNKLGSALLNAECEDQAEMEVLGFKLERLTLRLSHEWKLSDLLESALRDKKGTDPRVRSINLGHAIAQASEKGWDCSAVKEIIKEVRNFLHLSEKETIKTLHESAMATVAITESYGAKKSSHFVPLPVEAP
jgi:HD-like signal output (HDOD) protein